MNNWSALEKVGPPEKWIAMKREYERLLLLADTGSWYAEQLAIMAKVVRGKDAELDVLKSNVEKMTGALQEISKGVGRYDTDVLKHAGNTIEDMISIATGVLSEINPEETK